MSRGSGIGAREDPAICLTEELAGADNVCVIGPFARKSVVGLAVCGMLALVWLPPEHVHATHTDEGHHAEVVHRHYEAHHPAGDERTVDHDADDLVQWLDSPFTSPTRVSQVPPSLLCLHDDVPVQQTLQPSRWTLPYVHASVHDPPWGASHGLRGPPLPLCLT